MATYIVTTLSDTGADGTTGPDDEFDGEGISLREAIGLANANPGVDVIAFSVTGKIVLAQGQLSITDQLVIIGDVDANHTPDIIIDANQASRVLHTSSDTTLRGLILENGQTTGTGDDGGAIRADGALTIEDSVIRNSQTLGANSWGGGIYALGSTVLTNTMVSGNSAVGPGGGISGGPVSLTNSTVSGNNTTGILGGGGGIRGSTVSLTNSTVSGNRTGGLDAYGGGIDSQNATLINSTVSGNWTSRLGARGGGIATAQLNLTNSLVVGNVTGDSDRSSNEIYYISGLTQTNSIVGGSAADLFASTYQVASGVLAGVLADNGGPVQTIALKADPANPALDKSGAGAPATDARGLATQDFGSIANTNGSARDLGAFELQYAAALTAPTAEARSLIVTTLDDVLDPFDNQTSLREALEFANDPAAGSLADGDADDDGDANDTITFDSALAGGTITLALGQLAATAEVTIDGDLDNDQAPDITIDANQASRVLHTSSATTLRGLILENGKTTGNSEDGGAIRAYGALTIADSVIRNSQTLGTSSNGGGIFASGDTVLSNAIVTGNSTTGSFAFGGGIRGETVSLTNSTVSGNSTAGFYAHGGGVMAGSATLANSTVSGNSTTGSDALGGGIAGLRLSLTNSTVSGNSTSGGSALGGGIGGEIVSLTNSTVSGNSTSGFQALGGGVFAYNRLDLINSLVAGNVTTDADTGTDEIHFSGGLTQTNSIVGGSAADLFGSTYEVAPGVLAGVLADNGGPVQTIALKIDPANPALDKSGTGAPATDARGLATQDFGSIANANGSARDLGAYELQYADAARAPGTETRSLIVTTLDDVLDPYDGKTSLREALVFADDPTAGTLGNGDADENGFVFDVITFDAALSGGKITLALGQLETSSQVVIDGDIGVNRTPDITIDAHGASRVLVATGPATLYGLILENGKTTGNGESGGAIRALAQLTLADSIVRGSSTEGSDAQGGGIHAAAFLYLLRSTVSGNATTGDGSRGGGISAENLVSNDSTISGNSTKGFLSGGGGAFGATAYMANTTVSGNSTTGANAHGGGISSGFAQLLNTTVSGNSIAGSVARGGGVYAVGTPTITDSLIVGNVKSGDAATANNLFATVSVNLNRSLIAGDATKLFATMANVIDGNGVDTGIKGGVLAANGGPVQTIALLADPANPALDKSGPGPVQLVDARGGLVHDFIGIANTNGTARDLGSFELQPDPAAATPSVTNATTDEDIQSTSGLVISRNPLDGAEVTHFKITAITNGTLFLSDGTTEVAEASFITFAQANAGLRFTPDASFNGTGSFQVQASLSNADAGLGGSPVTATITVVPVNDAPKLPASQSVTTLEDVSALFTIGATDGDGDKLSYSVLPGGGPLLGSVSFSGDAFRYTPIANAFGSDSFTIVVSDGQGGTAQQEVNVAIAPVPDAPIALPDTFATNEGVALKLTAAQLTANDSDADDEALTVTAVTGARGGTAVLVDGVITFTPARGFAGSALFDYTVADGSGATATARVTVNVANRNDAPVVTPAGQALVTLANTSLALTVSASDADSDPLSYVASGPAHGSVVANASGMFTYTPVAGYLGSDAFTVTVSDGRGGSAMQAVSVAVVDLPSANDWRLIATDGFAGAIGGSGQVSGTLAAQHVTVLDLPGTILFDASFNKGGDTIELPGNAAQWRVMLAGSQALFSDGDTWVSVPVGPAGTAIAFADGVRTLGVDDAFRIGSQTITGVLAPVVAQAEAAAPAVGDDTSARGLLILGAGQEATIEGAYIVRGTNSDERVEVLGGDVIFDASFNRGGDVIAIDREAAGLEAVQIGSSLGLGGLDLDLLIPAGDGGTTLEFTDGDRVLAFSGPTLLLDGLAIGFAPLVLA